jgi:hypothetical protein
MAVLGSNTLNHSADLFIQRAGTTRITINSAGLVFAGSVTAPTFTGALSGTATNANQLGGHVRDSGAATANTVAGRNGSGDIFARLIRQTFANQTTISGGMVFRVNDSTDNFLRVCSDTAAIRTFLDVPTRTGGNASGTWGIAITGNAATATTATNCSRQIINGNGMNFTGGELNTNRTITLGTPGTLNSGTTNSVTTSSHTHNITVVGTVSQSGGNPTGAIIQQGTNSNGRWIRYADGTQIALINRIENRSSSGLLTTGVTLPVTFANASIGPQTRLYVANATMFTTRPDNATNIGISDFTTTTLNVHIVRSNQTNTAFGVVVGGRWF